MGLPYGLKISTRLLILVYCAVVNATSYQNITITVPEGTSNHGDPGLLCTPASWTDMLSFYLGNYIAHAATVITAPGEAPVSMAINVIIALLFPTSGVIRGISTWMSFAKFAKTNLRMAARAQALCMVVRKLDWKPAAGDTASGAIIRVGDVATQVKEDVVDIDSHVRVFEPPWCRSVPVPKSTRIIHGSYRLPAGYRLVYVPQDAEFVTDTKDGEISSYPSRISCTYSVVKILVALGQSLYAALTLFRSRGDQIEQYGYAAFGLTVAQYAVMSIVNLLGNLMAPEYPALYLVDSSMMAEARKHEDAFFDGVVGTLIESPDADFISETEKERWLAQPLKFESLEGQNRLQVEVELLAPQNPEQPSMETGISSRTTSQDAIEMSYQTKKLAVSVASAANSTSHSIVASAGSRILINSPPEEIYDGRPILYVPTCAVLKRNIRSKQTKPQYTIASASEASRPLIYHNLKDRSTSEWRSYVGGVLITAIPIAIIGALSGFQTARSTLAQRVWTMTWLCFGVFFGVWMRLIHSAVERNLLLSGWTKIWGILSWIVVCAAPAVGGFVVVGQMLVTFGTCVSIS